LQIKEIKALVQFRRRASFACEKRMKRQSIGRLRRSHLAIAELQRYPGIEVFAKDAGHKPFRLRGRPLRLCDGSEPQSGGGGGSCAGNLPSRSQGQSRPSPYQQRERLAVQRSCGISGSTICAMNVRDPKSPNWNRMRFLAMSLSYLAEIPTIFTSPKSSGRRCVRQSSNFRSNFREIVILREYEELSYQEIAHLLKCPIGTVMSRLARTRSKLRELLSVSWQPRPTVKDRPARDAS
jgi:hypothetical protein